MADLPTIIKDAAYVGIGFTILTVQKVQVQRQELKKRLGSQLGGAKGGVSTLTGTMEDRVKFLEERLQGV